MASQQGHLRGVPANKRLLAGSVPANKRLLAGTVIHPITSFFKKSGNFLCFGNVNLNLITDHKFGQKKALIKNRYLDNGATLMSSNCRNLKIGPTFPKSGNFGGFGQDELKSKNGP